MQPSFGVNNYKVSVTTSESVFRQNAISTLGAYASHAGFSRGGFLHSCDCRLLLVYSGVDEPT